MEEVIKILAYLPLYGKCNVLGDESHCIYDCVDIPRRDLDLPMVLSSLWNYKKVNTLF